MSVPSTGLLTPDPSPDVLVLAQAEPAPTGPPAGDEAPGGAGADGAGADGAGADGAGDDTITEQVADTARDQVDGLLDLISPYVPDQFEWLVATVISPGLSILLILVVASLLLRLAKRGIRRTVARMKRPDAPKGRRLRGRGARDAEERVEDLRREQRADALGGVASSVASVVVWSMAIIMVLGQVQIQVGPLIAGAGIVGIAVGFGAQDLVKDFLSGVFMLLEDQYGVGDIVNVGEASGVVEGISLRSTRIRDVTGTLWHVPNGEIRRVGNMSQEWARALLDVEVAYGADVDAAADVIERVARDMCHEEEYAELFLDEPEMWGIENLGADGVDIRLVIKTQPGKQWAISRELRRRIKHALDEAGIEIPFQQRTVWLRTEQPVALGGADVRPYAASVPDEATKRRAVEASKKGDTHLPPSDLDEMLPPSADEPALDDDLAPPR